MWHESWIRRGQNCYSHRGLRTRRQGHFFPTDNIKSNGRTFKIISRLCKQWHYENQGKIFEFINSRGLFYIKFHLSGTKDTRKRKKEWTRWASLHQKWSDTRHRASGVWESDCEIRNQKEISGRYWSRIERRTEASLETRHHAVTEIQSRTFNMGLRESFFSRFIGAS